MRLEVGSIAIQNVDFGGRTAVSDGTLVVDPEEIRTLVLEDPHFAAVDVYLVRPGEPVRLVHALDVVEPRWKVAGPGGVFPGFVSPARAVGEGKTNRLAGVAVVAVGEPVPGEPTFWRERIVDMAGPGADYSPFGKTRNVVLHFKPNLAFFPEESSGNATRLEGSSPVIEYNRAISRATMKVAACLGRSSVGLVPDDVETFTLGPCDPALPQVVCVHQYLRWLVLYGSPVALPVGTILHPNEFFDGAVMGGRSDVITGSMYCEQNNEALLELCRAHGKTLSFQGCILFSGDTPHREDKERIASSVVKLARMVGAEAALLLGINGSNHNIDLMWALQGCERVGIKTVLLYQDCGYGPDDPGFVYSVPEADTIVCVGSRDQMIALPPMSTVIGGDHLVDPDLDARGDLALPIWYLHSSLGIQGYSTLTSRLE